MPRTEIDGVGIHYEVDGEGPPLVVVHGGLGLDHVVYRRTLAPLADEVRMITYDQRGNGRSVPADLAALTMERLADDAAALADHLGLDRFAVLGHSYGGFVAQEVALRHPDRVSSLVLVDTTPGQLGDDEIEDEHGTGPPMPAEPVAIVSGPPPVDDAGMAAVMANLLPSYFRHPERVDLDAAVAGTSYRAAAMVRGFEVLATWSSVDRLAAITAPTLVVVGRHDVFTAWPQSMRIGARIVGAEVVVFEDSGHFPWVEEPERFFPLVREWLRR
jgi:proline iminopeptidase